MPEVEDIAGKRSEKQEKEEEAVGSAAIVVAIIYGIGLVMNNTFLSKYGISDFAILKPKALFTGAIVVGSLAVISASPLFVISRYIDQRASGKISLPHILWDKQSTADSKATYGSLGLYLILMARLIAPFIVLVFLNYIFVFRATEISLIPLHSTLPRLLGPVVLLYLSSCLVSILAIQGFRKVRDLKKARSFAGIARRFSAVSMLLTFAVVGLGLYLAALNSTFYPLIPSLIGGPGLGRIQFEVSKDAIEELEALDVKFSPKHPNLTLPIQVIYESDDAIYVLASRTRSFKTSDPTVVSDTMDVDQVVKLEKKQIVGSLVVSDNGFGGGGDSSW